MQVLLNWWKQFAEKHPGAFKWIREGGLFVIVCNLITVFKYLILQFLHAYKVKHSRNLSSYLKSVHEQVLNCSK